MILCTKLGTFGIKGTLSVTVCVVLWGVSQLVCLCIARRNQSLQEDVWMHVAWSVYTVDGTGDV